MITSNGKVKQRLNVDLHTKTAMFHLPQSSLIESAAASRQKHAAVTFCKTAVAVILGEKKLVYKIITHKVQCFKQESDVYDMSAGWE